MIWGVADDNQAGNLAAVVEAVFIMEVVFLEALVGALVLGCQNHSG